MIPRAPRRRFFALLGGLPSFFWGSVAVGQPEPPPDGVTIGEFWFRPSLELRLRGDFVDHAIENRGEEPVLGSMPVAAFGPEQQWAVHERTRLALSVERGLFAGTAMIEDTRLAGFPSPTAVVRSDPAPATGVHLAFLEARSPDRGGSIVRVGRQEVAWGDGRLLGISDWSPNPRALDAIRARLVVHSLDVEALAVLLSPPGSVPPALASQAAAVNGPGTTSGAGAQLYGLDGALHLDPLFHAEILGLARVARPPLPPSLTSSDLLIIGVRLSGDRAGVTYAAEFAYELGRFTDPSDRTIAAYGAAARAGWQSSSWYRLKLELEGSYASGGDGAPGASHRFDPLLPDDRAGLGQMGVYAWTNIADAAAKATVAPVEDVFTVTAAYRYVRLADPAGAWFSASLVPIGQNPANASAFLGHELDLALTYAPVAALVVRAGYGAFITGAGARALLVGAAPALAPKLLSSAFLQARLTSP